MNDGRAIACLPLASPLSHSICRHKIVQTRRRRTRRPTAAAGSAGQSPPPYTALSAPVYSLSTVPLSADASCPTMNITTYASPIAISPHRCFVLGLYKGTLSRENMLATKTGVLQILRRQHAPLVELLGKKSGRDIDKLKELESLGFKISYEFGTPILNDHAGVMDLKIKSDVIDCGDHDVVVCDVVDFQQPSGEGQILYTDYLKENGFL